MLTLGKKRRQKIAKTSVYITRFYLKNGSIALKASVPERPSNW